MKEQLTELEKHRIKRSIKCGEDFYEYCMKRNKTLLSNRLAYIKYFLDEWEPKNRDGNFPIKPLTELSTWHLFITEKQIYRIIKES